MSEDEIFHKLQTLGKEQRAAYVMHEVKNLLTPIMGYSYMLAEHPPVASHVLSDGATTRDILREKIYDNARQLARLFQQLASHPDYLLVIESRNNLDSVGSE